MKVLFSKIKSIALTFLLGCGSLLAQVQKEVDCYILAGQSNMQGSGKLNEVGERFSKPLKDVFLWNNKKQKFVPYSGTERFGPELGFVHQLRFHRSEGEIYIVKLGLSGQPLYHGIDDQRWIGDTFAPNRKNFYPGKEKDDPNQGLHYINLMKQFQAAKKSLTGQNKKAVLKGVVWMQGEADAKFKVSGSTYGKSLAHFKNRLEEDAGSGVVPFVFGKVLPGDVVPERFKAYKELHAQMESLDMESGHKNRALGMCIVEAPKHQLKKDNVHYTSNGFVTLGVRFANAMVATQKILPAKIEAWKKRKRIR